MSALEAIADWLVEVGYPYDFRTDPPPPAALQAAVEEAWVRRDGGYDDDDGIRATVADEGGWVAVSGGEQP